MRYAIRSPRYGVEYGSTLLIMLISIAFALISPLITLFGAAFCGGMWIYWRCVCVCVLGGGVKSAGGGGGLSNAWGMGTGAPNSGQPYCN
jgi:hypothetical protein